MNNYKELPFGDTLICEKLHIVYLLLLRELELKFFIKIYYGIVKN